VLDLISGLVKLFILCC